MHLYWIAILLFFITAAFADERESLVNADGVTLRLHGIGVAQELQSDLYLGAIYLPDAITSIPSAMSSNTSKRMTFKVLANFLPTKALQRHWKERIALNNPRAKWQANGDTILRFSSTFKDNLKRGDKVDFDYSPTAGTRIYLNEQLLDTLGGEPFFNLLMSAWFGDLPPTKSFKTALLNAQAGDERQLAIQQFASLHYTSRPLLSAAKVDANPESETALAAPVKSSAKPAAATVVASKANTKASTTVAVVNGKPEPVAVVQEMPRTDVKTEAKTEIEALAITTAATSAASASKIENQNALVDEDLLIGAYKREALERIRGFLEFPPRAWRLGLTGSGLLRANINREGQLLSSEIVQSTGQMILDQAMNKMLERSLPLPPPPPELSSNELMIEVPVDFIR